MSKLSVSEIFFSLQGEGIYIGIPQVFVRFCGCNLRCAYCDTAAGRAEEYDPLTLAGQVRRMMKKHTARSISLTGGEPLLQSEKIRTFLKKGRFSPDSVYLETNGTLSQEFIQVRDCVGIVAVDIKLPSSTAEAALWPQHERFLRACRGKKFFVKAIICLSTTLADIRTMAELLRRYYRHTTLVLQPNHNEMGLELIQKAMRFQSVAGKYLPDVRVIAQMHKFMGVR